jgi:hypothetical protein
MGTFQGIGYWGYDNVKQQYVSVWMDSMGTGISIEYGTCDDSHKVFTMHGEYDDPWTGQHKKTRSVTTIINDGKFTFEMFEVGPDGKEVRTLHVVQTRV